MTEIDIIILSYAQNEELKNTTLNCLNSLMISEAPDQIKFNVVVIESEKSIKPYQYPNSHTIYPEQAFGYHKYMNIGISVTYASFICLCNNDLVFHPFWATEILNAFYEDRYISSASPVCSIHHPKMGIELNNGIIYGYRIRFEVSGWCIFLKRDIFRLIGKLDENYLFWCADNDYANTLGVLKLRHALVTSSIVDHLENVTLNKQSEERIDELTEKGGHYFYKKWKPRLGDGWQLISNNQSVI
ncbi:glycosyltransferase family 2 protein [Pedobacter sp. AW31-3R]|uniref:glycosyltransferase family 2 protein n=1 Tax=Pedobacter sp. AW31-3R TaxID=3445781 RepID=UPI003F9FFB02